MKAKPTYKQLEYQVMELHAQLIHVYYFAQKEVEKLKIENLMGSGVLLQFSFLGGKQAITPVVIKDGLSQNTIAAIQADLKRSYDALIEFKPK